MAYFSGFRPFSNISRGFSSLKNIIIRKHIKFSLSLILSTFQLDALLSKNNMKFECSFFWLFFWNALQMSYRLAMQRLWVTNIILIKNLFRISLSEMSVLDENYDISVKMVGLGC